MNREELLSKWAELAPGECSITTSGNQLVLQFLGTHLGMTPLPISKRNEGMVLSALIEAIRARGWHYRLQSDETDPENEQGCAWHRASVYPDTPLYTSRDMTESRAEPCDALLSAYMAALEASKGEQG
jgi:hypothetical protein